MIQDHRESARNGITKEEGARLHQFFMMSLGIKKAMLICWFQGF